MCDSWLEQYIHIKFRAQLGKSADDNRGLCCWCYEEAECLWVMLRVLKVVKNMQKTQKELYVQ